MIWLRDYKRKFEDSVNILAIDTSTKTLALAVIKNGDMAAFYNYTRQMRHSKNLIRGLDRVLKDARISIQAIDQIACGVGPGSYTGLRIGHSFVKGLAVSRNIPVTPFSSLELIAYNIKPKHRTIAVVGNARRGKFYCAIFTRSKKGLRRRCPDSILSLDETIALMNKEKVDAVTGDALEKHVAELLPHVADASGFYPENLWYAHARHMAELLARRTKLTGIRSEKLFPNYLRITEAEEKFGRVM
jgi:tRNA threonylcarbamoyladenosine biosynthesis protein TsaB